MAGSKRAFERGESKTEGEEMAGECVGNQAGQGDGDGEKGNHLVRPYRRRRLGERAQV
jgi:hypothetical protein